MSADELTPGLRSALMLQEIGDALDVGVFAVDHELRITRWNRWLEIASGTPADAVVGRPVADSGLGLRPSGIAALERAAQGATVMLSQSLHGHFIDLPAPGGYASEGRMHQSVRILPVLDEARRPSGAAAIIEDVTERVARERELRAAMEAAQAANQIKSDFLAAMSHELRTPIGAMTGYAELLSEGMFGEVAPVQREQLQRIRSVGGHLLAIVDEILTFARLEAGREELHLSDVDAGALARAAMLTIEPALVKKGVALEASIPDTPIRLHTDPTKVRQILINLLGNAAKFTDAGSVRLDIRLSDDGTTLYFVVTDTGPGIPPDDLSRIFEAFTQVNTSYARSHGGTGLGLTVSRRLARMLGGDITVCSEMGKGSTFTATIPVAS